MSKIVQIDLDKLDVEIAQLQKQLDAKVSIRNYILEYSKNEKDGSASLSTEKVDALTDVEAFVLEYVSDGVKRVDKLINAFANSKEKEYKDVSDKVKEAIAKLENQNKILSEYDTSLKRTVIKRK